MSRASHLAKTVANKLPWESPLVITIATAKSISSPQLFPTTTKHSIATTAAGVSRTSVISPVLPLPRFNGKKFEEVPPVIGTGLADVITARGAAFGDLFNDGHVDVVINNLDGPPTLLRNISESENHWLTLKLIGGPKSPRDAIGTKVFLTAGGFRQRMDVFSGGTYQSSSDLRVHFGLGKATKIDSIEIHWPRGLKQTVDVTALNKTSLDCIATITEGQSLVLPPDAEKSPDKKP